MIERMDEWTSVFSRYLWQKQSWLPPIPIDLRDMRRGWTLVPDSMILTLEFFTKSLQCDPCCKPATGFRGDKCRWKPPRRPGWSTLSARLTDSRALVRQSPKPNVLSGHEDLSWAPPSRSPHFTHEKSKAGRAEVGCFTLWYLFMSMAWSWGENLHFRRH